MMHTLQFRKATPADASLVARLVLEALHWEMFVPSLTSRQQSAWSELSELCLQEDVLYSYRHATVALWGDLPIGVLLAYDGARYRDLRSNTFAQLTCLEGTAPEHMADEAQAGEWYIDTLAVMPEARGRGVGRALLEQALQQAAREGLPATLLVDPDNAKARGLYASMGFVPCGEVKAFGQVFWRMSHQ